MCVCARTCVCVRVCLASVRFLSWVAMLFSPPFSFGLYSPLFTSAAPTFSSLQTCLISSPMFISRSWPVRSPPTVPDLLLLLLHPRFCSQCLYSAFSLYQIAEMYVFCLRGKGPLSYGIYLLTNRNVCAVLNKIFISCFAVYSINSWHMLQISWRKRSWVYRYL